MFSTQKLNQDMKAVAFESGNSQFKSEGAIAAAANLNNIHPQLANITEGVGKVLMMVDVDASRSDATTGRMASSIMSDLVAMRKQNLTGIETMSIVRSAARSVIIKEAAGQVYAERHGFDPARKVAGEEQNLTQGRNALDKLGSWGIDKDKMFGEMPDDSLKMVSLGNFEKVESRFHDRLANALEVPVGNLSDKGIETDIQTANQAAPLMQPSQRHRPATVFNRTMRQPSFGRRIAVSQMAAAAGQGM